MSFVRDNKLMIFLKIVIALYQIPATLYVFHDITLKAGRSDVEAYVSAFAAVILIDALLLTALHFLESSELSPSQKVPWAVAGILLSVAIFLIGFQDEGITAWMPRVAVFILVGTDVFNLFLEWYAWFSDFDRRIERSKRNREWKELKIANSQIVHRRERMQQAHNDALNALKEELLDLHIRRERVKLGILIEPVEDQLVTETDQLEATEFPGVYKLPNNTYGWTTNGTSTLRTRTVTGTPYTLKGANVARKRALSAK